MTTATVESQAVSHAPTRPSRPLRLCYFGAAPDTSNLGVSALCYSVLQELARLDPAPEVTVFDFGRGRRRDAITFDAGPFVFDRLGAKSSRRIWQRETFWNIRWSARLGGLGNPVVEAVRSADAVLDISGGDSFTDLYGPQRFESVVAPKQLALDLGVPLILMPQTYGPFRDSAVRRRASEIVKRASMCWARDPRSFEILRDLLGDVFDPDRHHCGVDVAFALESRPPRVALGEPIAGWLRDRGRDQDGYRRTVDDAPFPPSHLPTFPPLLGLNVSGLIYNDPVAMRERYGFKADYREIVHGFLRRVLLETEARVLLIPHVVTPPGHYESDPGANDAVLAALRNDPDSAVRAAAASRLAAAPPLSDCREAKWLISRCDWFCGTRMHATIAGLSSGVPTAAIAYSDKTRGVFESVLVGRDVRDPRIETSQEIVASLCGQLVRPVRGSPNLQVRSICVEELGRFLGAHT
ncbi:MAG: polysaccharide pyruvyl transferase family protein [Phycisphaerales bacterium]|nr:polysaccharide pyruvyl transferase family protein [Phycisphaerales bacterium]